MSWSKNILWGMELSLSFSIYHRMIYIMKILKIYLDLIVALGCPTDLTNPQDSET